MEKGGNGEEKKENCKREGGKLKMEGGKIAKGVEDLFFFAFHFSKRQKFVLGVPKWKFSTGEKNKEKITLPPQKKFPVTPLAP